MIDSWEQGVGGAPCDCSNYMEEKSPHPTPVRVFAVFVDVLNRKGGVGWEDLH